MIGRRGCFQCKHGIVQRRIDAFTKENIVDIRVTLKQLHRGDLLDGPVNLLRRTRRRAANAKRAHVESPLLLPFFKNVPHVGVAARYSKRSQSRTVYIAHQRRSTGLELVGGNLWHSRRDWTRCRDVASDYSRGTAAGVTLYRTLDEV